MTTENNRAPPTPDETPDKDARFRDLSDKIKDKAAQSELFLPESLTNNYKPAPPDGWFALSSSKRRIFMRLENGRVPMDKILERLRSGKFNELPLSLPTASRKETKS